MNELVSIIVPVYNVEDYLEQCIDSIVNQTYSKLEIILINDGSCDNSSLICEDFAKKDPRIKYISKINQGVSIARNEGLAVSTGKFVTFIDADDYVEPNYIEKLLNNMSDQIDLVCCSLPINSKLRGKTLYHPQDIAKLFCEFGYTWGKLIRRSCIERPFHPDVWYAEDFIFYIHLIKNLKCIRTLDWDGYHYRIRIGSLSAKDKCERHTEQEFIRKITFATHYQENMSLIASYDLETKKIIKNHCYYTFSLLVLLLCRLRKDHIAINKKYLRNLLKLMRSNYIDFAQVTGWKNRNVKRFSLGTTLLFFPGLGTRIADFLLK